MEGNETSLEQDRVGWSKVSGFQSLQIGTRLSFLLCEKPDQYTSAMRNKGCVL